MKNGKNKTLAFCLFRYFPHGGLQPLAGLHRVGVGLLLDHEHDRALPVQAAQRGVLLLGVPDLCHVPQVDHPGGRGGHDHLPDLVQTPELPGQAHGQVFLLRARREGLRVSQQQGLQGELYLNTHPSELQCDCLRSSLSRLRGEFPDARIVIEIHETAVTSLEILANLRGQLRQLDMRLAYDDFGVGQSRLVQLAEVPPDYLKFDISFIQNIDNAPVAKRQFLSSIVSAATDLGVMTVAEGIEAEAEAAACCSLGFTHGQGFLFGRPVPASEL